LKHDDSDICRQGTRVLQKLLQRAAVASPDPLDQLPVIVDVTKTDNQLEVTVIPPEVGHPVTLELTIVSATLIPWRPRRKRKRG